VRSGGDTTRPILSPRDSTARASLSQSLLLGGVPELMVVVVVGISELVVGGVSELMLSEFVVAVSVVGVWEC